MRDADSSAQRRGKRLGKTTGLCLLSSRYLVNVFNKEKKNGPVPKNGSHITHVHPRSPSPSLNCQFIFSAFHT